MLPGLTLCVCPLLALMREQAATMRAKGMPVDRLDSTHSWEEHLEIRSRVNCGITKLLFVSPERFVNESFLSWMKGKRLSLLAIDEAHCVSEWGHSFRPDYLRLPDMARDLQCERVLLLTATATSEVAEDMLKAFQIPQEDLVRTPMHRPNLELSVASVEEEERDGMLLERLSSRPRGPTIIYATRHMDVEHVTDLLKKNGYEDAASYHAGLKNEERQFVQDRFMESADGIIVATIAFGMGLDKSNIRYVYHYNLSRSMEAYTQEIGRAGRDGEAALCEVLFCPDDVALIESYTFSATPSKQALKKLLKLLFAGARVGDEVRVSMVELTKNTDINKDTVNVLMVYLELYWGLLKVKSNAYEEFKAQFWNFPGARAATAAAAMPLLSAPGCGDESLCAAIRSCIVHKATTSYLSVKDLKSRSTDFTFSQISRALGAWEEKSAGKLKITPLKRVGCFTIAKLPESIQGLTDMVYQRVKQREMDMVQKFRRFVSTLHEESCLTQSLVSHFGEALEGGACGHCRWCLKSTAPAMVSRKLPEGAIDEERWEQLKNLPQLPRDDPRLLARFAVGISSPRLTMLKLSRHPLFGFMFDHDFYTTLSHCEEMCGIEDAVARLTPVKRPRPPRDVGPD
jgi:ATP-dependent DNA helicase RecQ